MNICPTSERPNAFLIKKPTCGNNQTVVTVFYFQKCLPVYDWMYSFELQMLLQSGMRDQSLR